MAKRPLNLVGSDGVGDRFSFEPYSDGVGVMRDAQTAKPQNFITGGGWFVYNLVTNLAKR